MTTYEARQERPCYLDGSRRSHKVIAYDAVSKEHTTFAAAERYARRILGQRPGIPVEINRRVDDRHDTRVAIVSRDAYGRTWCDVLTMDATI